MKPVDFIDSNVTMGAPQGWDPAVDGPCDAMPARVSGHVVTTVWQPTPEDLAMLVAGAVIVLDCYGVQPPVAMAAQFVKTKP